MTDSSRLEAQDSFPGAHGAPVRAAPLAGVDSLAVFSELGKAMREATEALKNQALRAPAAAFRVVAAADRALAPGPELFAALQPLLEVGEPGEVVQADLDQLRARLAELEEGIAPLRVHLHALTEAADRLRAEAAQRDVITAQIAELERLERLAAGMAELKAQRDELERRAGAVAGAVADVGADIHAVGERLIVLTGDLLGLLDADVRDTLRRAAEQDSLLASRLSKRREVMAQTQASTATLREELEAAEAAAAAAAAEFERLQAEIRDRLASLRRHAELDQAICSALTALPGETDSPGSPAAPQEAITSLAEAEVQLAAADAALAAALDERQRIREAELARRRLDGAGPSTTAPEEE